MITGEAIALPRHFKNKEWFEIHSEGEKVMLEVTAEILSEKTIREIYDRCECIYQTVDELEIKGLCLKVYTEVIEL